MSAATDVPMSRVLIVLKPARPDRRNKLRPDLGAGAVVVLDDHRVYAVTSRNGTRRVVGVR
jgi:hypothetical protein